MKKNKSSNINLIKRIGNFSLSKFISNIKLAQLKSKRSLKSDSLIFSIQKKERLKNILEKINKLTNLKSANKKVKKSKKSDSLVLEISKTEKYKNLLEKIKQFKTLRISNKKVQKSNKSISSLELKNINKNLFKVLEKINYFKFFDSKFKFSRIKNNEKYDQKIGMAFYGDHNLIIVSTIVDLNNNIEIISLNEMPIPGHVIGDSLVEDSNELANIILDSLTLLDLLNSPFLVILSSSFFNIHTFKTSDLKQISQYDNKIQSKSPYLPADTLVDFLRMSAIEASNGLVRTIYSKRDFIKSWTDTLEIVNVPIIGVVPAAIHIFDCITSKVTEESTVLLDIESKQTTLLMGSNLANLESHKLPFGYSLYLTNNLNESSKNYFERALNSVKLILDETNHKLPPNIFVMGQGLDKILNSDFSLPKGFLNISDLNLSNYSYKPKTMQIHETVSNSIENSVCSLATILSSCV